MERVSLSVIIPCYNEVAIAEDGLRRCCAVVRTLADPLEVYVIDDASTDGTGAVLDRLAKELPELRLVHHPRNLGIGPTMRELYAGAKHELVLNYSVDGDWEPDDLRRMVAAWQQADIIIGQRAKKDYSLYRSVVSWSYNGLPKLLFGVPTYDAGSVKLIPRRVLEQVRPKSTSVFSDAERVILAQRAGFTVTTIPIRHYAGPKRQRFGAKLGTVWSALLDMFRLRLRLRNTGRRK